MADIFSDPGYKNKVPHGLRGYSTPNYTPAQMKIHKQNYEALGPDTDLARMAAGDQSYFDELEAPALRQFSATQQNLANRYSGGAGRGGLSNRRSSGFQNQQGEFASNFSQQLQAQRLGLQRQAHNDLWAMSQDFLREQPYQRQFVPKKESKGNDWMGLAGAGVGAVGGFFLGGPAGALQGAQLGYGVGNSFSGGGGGGGGGNLMGNAQNMYNMYQSSGGGGFGGGGGNGQYGPTAGPSYGNNFVQF
jgi:hypothetical protein